MSVSSSRSETELGKTNSSTTSKVPVTQNSASATDSLDLEAVFQKARSAQEKWASLSVKERAERVRALNRALVAAAQEAADVVVAETGKLRAEFLMNEVMVSAEVLRYFSRIAPKVLSPKKVSPGLMVHKGAIKFYEPLGVVGVISPWNYPLVLSITPVAAALLAGNSVILKPSEFTPETGRFIGRLVASTIDVPDLVQVVTGAGEVGSALLELPLAKVVFTGSVRTGKAVASKAGSHLIPVVLELGGKDPLIVCDDADIKRAAKAAVWGAFTNSGQTCMATERVYATSAVYDAFLSEVLSLTRSLLEDPSRPQVGAMIHEGQVRIVEDHLNDALEKGARILIGGKRRDLGGRIGFEPTVVVNVNHSMKLMQEETFGPVLPIMEVETEEQAIELSNDSCFGLNASVFTSDPKKAMRIACRLQSGNVCINDVMVSYAIPALPYGGTKASGFGYTHGEEALLEMSRIKSVATTRLSPPSELHWYPLNKAKERLALLLARLRAR